MSDDLHQVLFLGGNGSEHLSDPESLGDAEHTARELTRKGYAVGSVMDVDSARRYMADRYAPLYRGVKIPDGLRADGQPRSVFEAWKRGVDAALNAAAPLLLALADTKACEFDALGACMTHDYPPPVCAAGVRRRRGPEAAEGGQGGDEVSEPRYACGLCGTWTCTACGWQRPGASALYPGQACIKCPSREGTLVPTMHTERMWRRHNGDGSLPEAYAYGERPKGELVAPFGRRTADTGPEFYRGVRVPVTGPYARLDVDSFKRGVDAALDAVGRQEA